MTDCLSSRRAWFLSREIETSCRARRLNKWLQVFKNDDCLYSAVFPSYRVKVRLFLSDIRNLNRLADKKFPSFSVLPILYIYLV